MGEIFGVSDAYCNQHTTPLLNRGFLLGGGGGNGYTDVNRIICQSPQKITAI